jgi:Fe-S oxidoreductase
MGVLTMNSKYLEELREGIFLCFGCGVCRGIWSRKSEGLCPVFATGIGFEDSIPRGRVTVAQDILDGDLTYSKGLAESLYRCTQCANCLTLCGATDEETGRPIIDIPRIVEAMKADAVEYGLVPPKVRDFLENIQKYGNPYGESADKRGKWAEGMGIKQHQPGDKFLLYIGCVGSYDTRSQQTAKALGSVLLEAGVSFGILGAEEKCDGNEVLRLGERDLFEHLAEENIKALKELKVKSIITLSPHSYNVMKNEYPNLGADFEVIHYTQFFRDLIKNKQLKIKKGIEARVTYHDPCFLGRYNDVYDAPREILTFIPGISLVEMHRVRENSFCCGGGGGNFYTDLIGGKENSPNRIRVMEAYNTGAQVLAVACPVCVTMLEDAVKSEELEDRLAVKDIAEIVMEAC